MQSRHDFSIFGENLYSTRMGHQFSTGKEHKLESFHFQGNCTQIHLKPLVLYYDYITTALILNLSLVSQVRISGLLIMA